MSAMIVMIPLALMTEPDPNIIECELLVGGATKIEEERCIDASS
jgi:hypothetical protein